MSRISEYIEQQAEASVQTVGEFALELRKSPEVLLEQLKYAGVQKQSSSDTLTTDDKSELLKYLQKKHGTEDRKEITVTVDSAENKLIRDVANQENGAEFAALEHLLSAMLVGDKIDPNFQKLVNLVAAKAVLVGALPMRKVGRPKNEDFDSFGYQVSARYFEMIDAGVRYEVAVERLSATFHKSERHIMRLVAKHKEEIGDTVEKRVNNREFWKFYHESSTGRDPFGLYKRLLEPTIPVPDFTHDDYMEHLDELIQQLSTSSKLLTKKV